MFTNQLFYGDNLPVLREHIPDESVDLVYLDPPFNSNQDYNILFAERDGSRAAAQIKAFGDTWRWDQGSALAYAEIVETGPSDVSRAMQAFRTVLGDTDMMAYLAMMAPRLVQLRRVLKRTGSIYLHCDPTASHYLKVLMDAVFRPRNYRNEIVWQRTNAHNTAGQYGRVHDTILFYTVSENYTWNRVTVPFGAAQLARYRADVSGRMYTCQDLTASRPNSESGKFTWRGTTPPSNRGWGYDVEQLEAWWEQGRIATRRDGTPRMDGLIVYLDEKTGKPLQSVWADLPRIANTSPERLGYPTQKPESLLERILLASSNPGDTILDPFCGCGTAVAAAHRLGRRWIGIDITHLATALIRQRLEDSYGPLAVPTIIGEPQTLPDAVELAHGDPYQFQWWLLGRVGARPVEKKKGADGGVDGRQFLRDGRGGHYQIVYSVKSGKLKPDDIRALGHVVAREGAQMGVLLTLNDPSARMRADAAAGGWYDSPWGRHAKLQIITAAEVLAGVRVDRPYVTNNEDTFKAAPRVSERRAEYLTLPGLDAEPVQSQSSAVKAISAEDLKPSNARVARRGKIRAL